MDLPSKLGITAAVCLVSAIGAAAIFAGPEEDPAVKEAACRADLRCWGDRHRSIAEVICRDPIEQRAKYSVRWTDSSFGSRFSRYQWADAKSGTITMIGDRVEFQNGFGAYQPMSYACDIDPVAKKVLDVVVFDGRLPQ